MYIDGYAYAVPKDVKADFIKFAQISAELFVKHGALRVFEAWGDQFNDQKDHISFAGAVKCKADEQVLFSWCEWPDKATRDASFEKIMKDMETLGISEMPFDGQRMIFGGFKPIVEA